MKWMVYVILGAAALAAPPISVETADDPPLDNSGGAKEWFDQLSKNITSGGDKALNQLGEWFSSLAGKGTEGATNNNPVLYMGTFQLLKMPMPQVGDLVQNLGAMANAANGVANLLPKLPIGQ